MKPTRRSSQRAFVLMSIAIACAGLFLTTANAWHGGRESDVNDSHLGRTGCCGVGQDEQGGAVLKPHPVAASFYSLKDGLTATLLLNNKGPRRLEAYPTLFSMAGESFEVGRVTVEPHSFLNIDLRRWAALAGPAFEEGSLRVVYYGGDLELGVQVYLVDEGRRLSFDEKLVELLTYTASRLEAVWWEPSRRTEVRLAVSNTTGQAVTGAARLSGQPGRRNVEEVSFSLGPHETRVIQAGPATAEGAGEAQGSAKKLKDGVGAASVTHGGPPGAVVARAMVMDTALGYSSTVQFSDPAKGKSERFEGVGLRLSDAAGDLLRPVVVARNVSDAPAILRGRVPYTTRDGKAGTARVNELRLAGGQAAVLDLTHLVEKGDLPRGAAAAGLEFEHTGEPGSVMLAAHSVSEDGDRVYRVPMWDPLAQRSATGGYPWRIDGDSQTAIYIKNITDRPRRFVSHLRFEGGTYVLGYRTVEAHQTVSVDIRELRDKQSPDHLGRTIPPATARAHFQWSLVSDDGPDEPDAFDELALLGRSEQADAGKGISSSYSCASCCQDSFERSYILPGSDTGIVEDLFFFEVHEVKTNCYGTETDYLLDNTDLTWRSSNTAVATVDEQGIATAVAPGSATISATWRPTVWELGTCFPGEYDVAAVGGDIEPNFAPCGACQRYDPSNTEAAGVSVVVPVAKIQYQNPGASTFADINGTLYVLKGTAVTFKAVPHPETAAWQTGRPVWGGTSGATGTGPTVTVTFNTASSSLTDFKTVTATSGNTKTVNVVVYSLTEALNPAVDFTGRSYVRFGIEEEINLSFTATPAVTAAQAGGLRWRIASVGAGNGTLAPLDDGTGTYTAPDTERAVTLKLEVLSGPSKGGGPTRGLSIVQPSGAYVTRQGGIRHTFNTWSAGFLGVIHITPEDVSFFNISFYEGAAPEVSSGWLLGFPGPHPRSALAVRIDSRNAVNEHDQIYSGLKRGPYGVGEWYWDIPWRIVTNLTRRDFLLGTCRQKATSDAAGKAVMSKCGASVTRVPSDPSSDW